MSAIVIQPNARDSRVVANPEDFMPIPVRMMLSATLNSAWAAFVETCPEPLVGPDLPEKFWQFVLGRV